MKLLVTGAAGFIGRALCARLSETDGAELIATVRCSTDVPPPAASIGIREVGPDTRWDDLLDSVDVVVHAAAKLPGTHTPGGLTAYRRVNVDGTLNLARQAAQCGVRRFVFLSSVKVNGDNTQPGHAFRAEDTPAPIDAYGRSKHEAEVALSGLKGNIEVVAIRPPIVYGPGVKANLLTLMRWVHKGYPLPFGRVENLRSLIACENLVDLIVTCCVHPRAANQTFMAADAEDLSTPELLTRIGRALNKPARLLPVSPVLLLALAAMTGNRDRARKILGNLQVDAERTRELLDWRPRVSMDQALESTARRFLEGLP